MKLLLNYILLALLLASTNLQAESKKIIKWVDKNGVTQYGDRVPLPSKAREASVLNKQGITLRKIEQRAPTTEQDKASAAQARQDNALLASFNSVEEIDIARKRNIKIDELALNSFQKKLERLNKELTKNNAAMLAFAKNNKVAPADIVEMLERNIADIALVESQIDERKQTIDKINQRFANNKARYKELESRKSKLYEIKYSKKNIAELKKWRNDAQKRIAYYEAKTVEYKRAGTQNPKHIINGLLSATRELERANAELEESLRGLTESKTKLSK